MDEVTKKKCRIIRPNKTQIKVETQRSEQKSKHGIYVEDICRKR